MVCEGSRQYRLCEACLQDSGLVGRDGTDVNADEPGLLLGVEEELEGNHNASWEMEEDDDLAEDSGADLIIQEVENSDEEPSTKLP